MEKASKNGSVEKALKILDFFSNTTPFLTLQQLSNESGYPKTTLFRLLCSLEKFGYIRRKQENGEVLFGLGWGFLEKANMVSAQIDIKELAKAEMISLRNHTGLSVQLVIKDGKEALYIDQIHSFNPIRVYPEIGRRVPLYTAACPRVLLAYAPEYEQQDIINDIDPQMFTSGEFVNREQLKKQLVFIKKNGVSISRGELIKGTIAFAVPIFDSFNEVIAALSVIGMEKDITIEDEKSIVESIKSSAQNITNKLKL